MHFVSKTNSLTGYTSIQERKNALYLDRDAVCHRHLLKSKLLHKPLLPQLPPLEMVQATCISWTTIIQLILVQDTIASFTVIHLIRRRNLTLPRTSITHFRHQLHMMARMIRNYRHQHVSNSSNNHLSIHTHYCLTYNMTWCLLALSFRLVFAWLLKRQWQIRGLSVTTIPNFHRRLNSWKHILLSQQTSRGYCEKKVSCIAKARKNWGYVFGSFRSLCETPISGRCFCFRVDLVLFSSVEHSLG